MIQPARSQNSKSLLRELEFSLVLIKNKKTRDYFLEKLNEVFIRQNDPSISHTGATKIKTELLAYLSSLGDLNTANIWARNLSLDRKNLNKLLFSLQKELLANGIEGVLEIHLQDREINSPHIQFVGINARIAEQIIAQILVKNGYENSVESALSKKDFKPYYLENDKAYTAKLNDTIEYFERKNKTNIDEVFELLELFDNTLKKDSTKAKFEKSVQKSTNKFLEKIKQTKFRFKSQTSILNKIRNKQNIRKLRRKRRKL